MEPTYQPLEPAQTPLVEARPVETKTSGVRRAVLTAAISGLLLVAGGVAVVSAASPEPSASPSTAAPSDGTTTTPSDGTTTPRTHSGANGDCPDKAGGGSGTDETDGTDGTDGSSTTPSTTPSTAPTPAT